MQTQNKPMTLSRIRSAIYSTPWAITPEWLETICAIVESHVSGEAPQPFAQKVKRGRRCPDCKEGVLKAEMRDTMFGQRATGNYTCPNCGCQCNEDQLPPYEIINRVAILELTGPLFPKANLLTMLSGATSYEEFSSDFSQAVADSNVDAVLIEADSPGGSCLRLSETCSRIFAARELGTKPIVGLIDPQACSAAYAIISQCDRVYITESGVAGSIGTILRYNNWERAERNEGNDPVMITSSDVKAFGNPQSLAQYQSLIDMLLAYYEQFKEIVQRGRPTIDINAVANAKMWIGKDAVRVGIADEISTMEEVLQELSAEVA